MRSVRARQPMNSAAAVSVVLAVLCCGSPPRPSRPANARPAPADTAPHPSVPVYGYRVVRMFPHDREAFTQGFTCANGLFYEGTGLEGRSSIRQVEMETGRVLRSRALASPYFGEGIAVAGNRLVQLTYTSRRGFIYRADTFDSLGSFVYPTEGWGITHDGHRFIMSDGSPTLRFLDVESMAVTDSLQVTDGGHPVVGLNELEYVQGQVFANLWPSFIIARIDPRTGRVMGWIDLRGILPEEELARVDVLNGIAFDAMENRLFVTGKLWPVVFEIELIPRP
ncbi:MAG: glutaminyl-peptide cyclotransferase [Candidatus Eisenbacteria bacterium]|nr:glutaminyl-peptide cyclotransferase [Candidatus Eisenbacteria bacterium]